MGRNEISLFFFRHFVELSCQKKPTTVSLLLLRLWQRLSESAKNDNSTLHVRLVSIICDNGGHKVWCVLSFRLNLKVVCKQLVHRVHKSDMFSPCVSLFVKYLLSEAHYLNLSSYSMTFHTVLSLTIFVSIRYRSQS